MKRQLRSVEVGVLKAMVMSRRQWNRNAYRMVENNPKSSVFWIGDKHNTLINLQAMLKCFDVNSTLKYF